jgi:dynein heavy chain 1
LLAKIRKLKSLSDEEELAYVVEESANATSNGLAVPSWMAQLMQRLTAWISMFPETVSQLVFDANKSPLERFIARESQLASQLLSVVRRDLSDLNRVLEGSAKHTNHTRSLMQDLVKGN